MASTTDLPSESHGTASSHATGSGTGSGTGSIGTGSKGTGTGTNPSSSSGLGHSACVFWLGPRCYALDTRLVGEVVNVERVTPVPMAPSAVLGLFNLRGVPVALVDLSSVLEVQDAPVGDLEGRSALVIRTGGLMAGVLIDRMEAVVTVGRGRYTPREGGEHPVVQGFLEVDLRGGMVVTVLEAAALMQRLEKLKYR
jgi:purine-binding chemotaxis protein CheW